MIPYADAPIAPTPVPTLSEWGTMLLGLLLLVYGGMYVRRQKRL